MTVDRTEPIRAGRLLLAGLVVGLTMNAGEAALHGGILVEAAEATYAALNLTASADPMNLVSLIVLTFAQGMLMAWLYAVVRPFFGTRPKTAVCGFGWVATFFGVRGRLFTLRISGNISAQSRLGTCSVAVD